MVVIEIDEFDFFCYYIKYLREILMFYILFLDIEY